MRFACFIPLVLGSLLLQKLTNAEEVVFNSGPSENGRLSDAMHKFWQFVLTLIKMIQALFGFTGPNITEDISQDELLPVSHNTGGNDNHTEGDYEVVYYYYEGSSGPLNDTDRIPDTEGSVTKNPTAQTYENNSESPAEPI